MKESATEQTDNAVVLQTMGCRLNHAEAAAIRGVLESAGTAVLPTVHPAAGCGYVLHTCAVTAAAQTEALRHLRSARRAGARPIVVSGCTANVTEPALLFEAGADVAVIREPEGGDYAVAVSPAAETAATAAALGKHVAEALRFPRCAGTLPAHASTRAPVKIQDGCSFRCSYCIVPDARGNPRSRPLADVLAECEALAAHGFRELVLTGGASFMEGDYSLSVFNGHGELETLTLTFRHEDLPSDVPMLLRDRDSVWRDGDGNTVDDPLSRDGRFQVTTRDSYGNLIVIESVRPSA